MGDPRSVSGARSGSSIFDASLYLVAIMDWHSRQVLAWRLSKTLEAEVCVEALDEAIRRHGPPEIMNTDQGAQFTAFAWTNRLRRAGIRISMDGKGVHRAFAAPPARRSRLTLDTIFIE